MAKQASLEQYFVVVSQRTYQQQAAAPAPAIVYRMCCRMRQRTLDWCLPMIRHRVRSYPFPRRMLQIAWRRQKTLLQAWPKLLKSKYHLGTILSWAGRESLRVNLTKEFERIAGHEPVGLRPSRPVGAWSDRLFGSGADSPRESPLEY